MRRVTNTRLLTLAFAASALGLAITVQDALPAQTAAQQGVRVIDDGDVTSKHGAYTANGFVKTAHAPAYGGTASYFRKGAMAASGNATWSFTGLGAGTYDVYATWVATPGFSTATYSLVGDAGAFAAQKTVDQKKAPSTMEQGGYKWEKIGTVTLVAKGGIGVFVTPASDGYAQADAVMITGNALSGTAQTAEPSAPRCGDGIQQTGEQCDDGNQVATDGCSNACKTPVCGDGIVQPLSWQPEQCDDGNQSSEDACTNECKLPRCGDGFKNGTEQCDNGAVGGPSCGPTCRLTVCGDRKVEGLEYCDDGNAVSGDGCSAQCVTEAPAGSDTQSVSSVSLSCENGTSYATVTYAKNHSNCIYLKKNGEPFEAYSNFCDGALNAPTTKKITVNANFLVATGDKVKACHPMIREIWGCTGEVSVTGAGCAPVAPVCGNGKKEGTEECDDGNQTNTDACTNACKNARCNDGFVYGYPGFEECDDGNYEWRDACSNSCKIQKCGNGIAEDFLGEQCDDNNTDNTDGCTNACKKPVCGDGFVLKPSSNLSYPGREWCDDGNTVSGDGCSSTCVTEAPAACGNGKKEGTEQCDDGNLVNGDGCSPTCQTQAITVGCGNGKIDAGEICDNGTNNVSFLTTQYGYCTTQCRPSGLSICGNGSIQGTEQCDDGNSIDTDACRNNCMLPTACGNGKKEGTEQCDDGNRNDNDACTNACNNAKCLDGIVWTNVEGCDDGNNINTDACSNVCTLTPVCGNGRQDYGEQCDDGNRVDTDACKNDCTKPATTTPTPTPVPQIPASCGNWVFDAGEQCDMGGVRTPIPNNATLCCTAACRVESCGAAPAPSCGNGVREGTEQCDDGNRVDTDACTNACTNAPAASNAQLTIRTVDLGPAPHGIVTSSSLSAMAFTATAGGQNVTLDGLRFAATEGNIQRGFFATLKEVRDGDVAGSYYPGRHWFATLQNGKFVFAGPIAIGANTTKKFEVELYTQCCHESGANEPFSFAPFQNPQVGPVRIDFDKTAAGYVAASATVNGVPTALTSVATDGACAAAGCQVAVFTGPTRTLDFRNAGNLQVIGESGAAAAQVYAGTVSPVMLRVKMRMSNHENGELMILPFAVEGAQAVDALSVTIDGVAVPDAKLVTDCRGQAPYSRYELSTQGFMQRLGLADFATRNEFCSYIDARELLERNADSVVEVRAKVKTSSAQWQNGTKVRVSLITDEHYLYVLGEDSGTPLRPKNTQANGGNVSYTGTLVSNDMTATRP